MSPLAALRVPLAVRLLPLVFPASVAFAQGDVSGLQWLQRIYNATRTLSYTGTFVYQHGQQIETSRIVHVVDNAGIHERLETLDGAQREIIRDNDKVVCYLPSAMTIWIDRQPGWRFFPGLVPAQLRDVAENYQVRKGRIERVAGYDCQEIVLEPKDRLRYGQRFWADLGSGMLLKVETTDRAKGVMEQFAFTELKLGGRIDRDLLKSRFSRYSRDWRIEYSDASQVNLAGSGWTLRSLPPGFHTVTELRRSLAGVNGVSHVVLSDGLAAISVFIEPVNGKPRALPAGLIRQGATNFYTRTVGDYRVTAVGEVPAESVKYVAEAVEYRR